MSLALPTLRREESANPDEKIHVISYPKSGRTWLRVLLSRYKQLLLGLDEFELKLHAAYSETPVRTPQFIFTHARSGYQPAEAGGITGILDWLGLLGAGHAYPFRLESFQSSPAVFLMRDPRDVVVSYYHQLRAREGKIEAAGLGRFVRSRLNGLPRVIAFMNAVSRQREQFNGLFVFYEDLHQSTADELVRILEFAGLPRSADLVEESVSYARFENMRNMELKGNHGDKLRPADRQDESTYKTRKGRVGTFAEELNERDIAYLEETIHETLDPFYQRYRAAGGLNA